MKTPLLKLKPCPFCGSTPRFAGDAADWQNDSRYVELSLTCCSTMTEEIGWKRARDMSVEARTAELQTKLAACWNTRADIEDAIAQPVPQATIWTNLDFAMQDPIFNQCRAIMGTANEFQDGALLNVLQYFAAVAQPIAKSASIEIDFKQATELLQMFGGEPTLITLIPGDGHSGKGLYADAEGDTKDAQRYRWLRSIGHEQLKIMAHYAGAELDKTIDAAIASQKGAYEQHTTL